MPNSVIDFGINVFENCPKLEEVYNTSKTILHYVPKNIEEYIIPETVIKIENNAFANCAIKSLIIPNSVKEIEKFAFYNCTKLKSITLPNSINTINNSTFLLCTSLQSINIQDTIRKICNASFASCKSLKNMIIPDTLDKFEWGAFIDCPSLNTVYNTSKTILYYVPKNIEEFTIIDSIEKIENNAFLDCKAKTLLVPDKFADFPYNNRKSIAIYNTSKTVLFSAPKDTNEFTIPHTVKSIDTTAFANCTKLKSITISNTSNITEEIFADCMALCELTIHNPITNAKKSFECDNKTLFDIFKNKVSKI